MSEAILIVTYADVSKEAETAFQIWQQDVQLARLRACPGVTHASYLDSIGGEPQFLLLCEVTDASAAASTHLRAALRLDEWMRALRGWHRRSYRSLLTMPTAVEAGDDDAPYLLAVSADVARGAESEFNRWYDDVHLPEVLACPGFVAASRYECVHGEPRFLALYDLERKDALTTPEMDRVYGFGPMIPHLRSEHGRIYARRRTGATR